MWALGVRFALMAAIFFAGWHMRDAEIKAADAKGVAIAADKAGQASAAAQPIIVAAAETRATIRAQTHHLQELAHAPPSDPGALRPMPGWIVGLHDAAIQGLDAPDPLGADAGAGDAPADQAADVLTGNAGVCREAIDRLTRLQGLLASYQKIYPPAATKPPS